MIHPPARLPAAVLAAGVLLAGCSTSDPTGAGSTGTPSDSAPASASASASPSPTSTLTAEEQQAFTEATEAVLAYRQTITDLYSGARTNLNDLYEVAAGDKVVLDLADIQKSLGEGWRYEPLGGQVALVSAKPVAIALAKSPQEVVIQVCVDTTGIADISPTGVRTQGIREELDYTLVRRESLGPAAWAVTRVATDEDDPTDRRC